jgi:NTE family protein
VAFSVIYRSGRSDMAMKTALILAGAVAKGAFEAGVLSVLARNRVRVSSLVGASSGALNVAVYAAGARRGHEVEATQRLIRLWTESADWSGVLSWRGGGAPSGRGLSNQRSVLRLLNEAVCGWPSGGTLPIEARFIVTRLEGRQSEIGHRPATTFEDVVSFSGPDFDCGAGNKKICAAAAASAAFPLVYTPAELPNLGACADGGIVNNTPIKRALESTDGIGRIIVVTPQPRVLEAPGSLRGTALLAHLADVLINERLFRDLHDAESINQQLAALTEKLGSVQAARVASVLGWKHLEIVEIRPQKPLRGNAFAGFGERALRSEYIELGQAAAELALPLLRQHRTEAVDCRPS